MSVYTPFPLPVITYSILHRPVPGVPREQYEGTIIEMHRRVEEESVLFGEQHAKSVAELSGRQAQMLRGGLGQFLETSRGFFRRRLKNTAGRCLRQARMARLLPGPDSPPFMLRGRHG